MIHPVAPEPELHTLDQARGVVSSLVAELQRKRPVGCIWRQSVGLCINGGHEPNLPPLRMSLHHGC